MSQWMIYGANGYTGKLMAREAVQRGLQPVLPGRNIESIEPLATELGLEFRIFSLETATKVSAGLEEMKLVLHCAGPFSATSQPMIEACLTSQTHYLDITGEIKVFENAWNQSDVAKRADVVLCPGTGFDVVPTDCLAARLVERLPAATMLQLAFEPSGGMSPGTAKTGIEGIGMGGMVRRDGELTRVPLAWKTRQIPFRHANRLGVTIPWGDVFTAWVSTGIPNIEVYISSAHAGIKRMKRMRLLQPLMRMGFVQNLMKKRIDRDVQGPDEQTRATSSMQLWGEARTADGRQVSATMETPGGYVITVSASLGIVAFLMENEVEGGYITPSLLMGSGYAETLPGVSFQFTEA